MQSIHCLQCKHYKYGATCEAFEKIPSEIMLGMNDHKKPYPGDKGIMYERAILTGKSE